MITYAQQENALRSPGYRERRRVARLRRRRESALREGREKHRPPSRWLRAGASPEGKRWWLAQGCKESP
jgi:hypothetical protein